MDIETVKKILDKGREGVKITSNGVANFINYSISTDELTLQVCQLFPKTPDNPDGYEPKPDESRLLTDEELRGGIARAISECPIENAGCDGLAQHILNKVHFQVEVKCQEKLKGIKGEIEALESNGEIRIDSCSDWWEAIWKKARLE